MGIYLGATALGGGSGGSASGGYIPGVVGFEFLALSGGGSGGLNGTYGGGGGGGGTLMNLFAYAHLDRVIPITVGAGGAQGGYGQYSGGSSVVGDGIFVTTILGGGGGTYSTNLTNDFGTCAGGRGDINGGTVSARNGNGFDNKGRIIGILETAEVNSSSKNINDTTTPFTNGRTNPFSGPGGAGLGGSAPVAAYNNGNIGGIGLDPTTITDRFLTQAEFISEGIGEVTSSVAYIGGGGSGYRASGRANPPGGCGAVNVAGLANTGGGGGSGASGNGGSGFVMLRLPTSQSVTTTGTVSTYTKGNDTVYVWKSTGSITLNS